MIMKMTLESNMDNEELNDLIDAIQNQNFNSAKDTFDSLLSDKLTDALDAEKIVVADTIFNGAEDEQLELDLDPEEDLRIDEEDFDELDDEEDS